MLLRLLPFVQVHSATNAVVKALADSFPSLRALNYKCGGSRTADVTSADSPSKFFSGSFFASLFLLLPGLKELILHRGFHSYGDGDIAFPPGCIHLVSGLTGLTTLCLPSISLHQFEVQLLANMPNLSELSVNHMHLDKAIDARNCAWRRLELDSVTGSPAQALFLPLKAGTELRIRFGITWTLGDATTPM